MKGGDILINDSNFLVPPLEADEHQPVLVDTIFGTMELMAPDLTGLKYNDVIEIGFKNDETYSKERNDIKNELKNSHGKEFRYIHGARGIGQDYDLYPALEPEEINGLWILGFQSMKNKLEFIRIVVNNGEYVLFDRTIDEELEPESLLYSPNEEERIKLIANKPDSKIKDEQLNSSKLKRVKNTEIPTLQEMAAKVFTEWWREIKKRPSEHPSEHPSFFFPGVKSDIVRNKMNEAANQSGGKRRTRRRRQRSNKKRTNKRKKIKTKMKKRKTHKRKTNKRRRKR